MVAPGGRSAFPGNEPASFYESPAHPHQARYDEKSDLGMRFMNSETEKDYEGSDDSGHSMEKRDMKEVDAPPPPPPYQSNPMNVAAPRPGYAAPIAMLNRPEPAAVPQGRRTDSGRPFTVSPSPSTPHPLQAPMTPITPIFARPNVQFAGGEARPIMRGNTEETLLPKRGEKGDDFWRRFSMIAQEENTKKGKKSNWLSKTSNKSSSWSKQVWLIGLMLLICVLGAFGLAWYVSHNKPDHQAPKAVGGSAGELSSGASTSAPAQGTAASGKVSLHVSPTYTVDRRDAASPLPTGTSVLPANVASGATQFWRRDSSTKRRRHARHVNPAIENRQH